MTNQFANRDAHTVHTKITQACAKQCDAISMPCYMGYTAIRSVCSEFDARIISNEPRMREPTVTTMTCTSLCGQLWHCGHVTDGRKLNSNQRRVK